MKKIEVLGIVNFKLETIHEEDNFEDLENWIEAIGFQDSCFSIKQGGKFLGVYVNSDLKVFYTQIDKDKAHALALV